LGSPRASISRRGTRDPLPLAPHGLFLVASASGGGKRLGVAGG
jgi:hypothetical protein